MNMFVKKSEVFDSRTLFPAMWHICLKEAQKQGFDFINFNGMVFKTIDQMPNYDNRICMEEDLG